MSTFDLYHYSHSDQTISCEAFFNLHGRLPFVDEQFASELSNGNNNAYKLTWNGRWFS